MAGADRLTSTYRIVVPPDQHSAALAQNEARLRAAVLLGNPIGDSGGRVMIRVEVAREVTPELHAALARLLPQLNPTLEPPDMQRLERMLADPAVTLLLARDGEDVVGTTTVIVYTTPFWIKARLDEVVVDASARGKGVGEALVKAALDIGRQRGAQVAELQSGRGPAREAAHRLYLKLGFEIRETDVMRIVL